MNKYFIGFIIIFGLFSIQCNNDVPVDYNNSHDPKSANYVPNSPSILVTFHSDTGASISWIDNSYGTKSFSIEYRTSSTNKYSVVAIVPVTSNSYFHSLQIYSDTMYIYRIGAHSQNDSVSFSDPFYVQFYLVQPYVYPIVSLTSSSVRLDWYYGVTWQTGFMIEKSISSGAFVPIDTTGGSIFSFTDTSLDTLKYYQYRVTSLSRYNRSNYTLSNRIKYTNGTWSVF
jgi:hypothetical protein